MKKKLIIGLAVFSLISLIGGAYILTTIGRSVSRLNDIIKLHQVEILRENLLIQIKRVQSDLSLKNTRYARGVDRIVSDVRRMDKVIDTCFHCHHSEEVRGTLADLRGGVEAYKESLSRVLTIRANMTRLAGEEDEAFRVGQELIERVDQMIALTQVRLNQQTQSTFREIARTKVLLFVLVSIGPLVAIGLALLFIRGTTKPVTLLLDATRRLKGGDLNYRIEGLTDEFGEVADSFNEMARALKQQMSEMQRLEQMKVVGELATGLAHEIKNPLAGIKVSMEVLAREPAFSEEDKAILLKVVDEVKKIESLMKNILDFAKPPTPQPTAVNVNTILDTALTFSLTYPSFSSDNAKKVHIRRDFDTHLPTTMADPAQLEQVFLNLLLNAGDATPDGGTVTARTSHDSSTNTIRIEIVDTGRGIDDETLNKIFHPFFTTKAKGTGLGLAISKQLVQRHGGEIHVSNNPGGGATFTVVLPVQRPEA